MWAIDGCSPQVPYKEWLPQEHPGEPTAAAAYATAEAVAKARGSHTCAEVAPSPPALDVSCMCHVSSSRCLEYCKASQEAAVGVCMLCYMHLGIEFARLC